VRTTFVFIDYENVQPASLASLEGGPYQVRVFVGQQQAKSSIKFELADSMQRLGRHAEYVRMAGTGNNALDFHIAYYLGRLAAEHSNQAAFRVIAKDTDYDLLIQHLCEQGIDCARHVTVEALLHGAPPDAKPAAPKPVALKESTPAPSKEQVDAAHAILAGMKAAKPKSVKTLLSTLSKHLKIEADVPRVQRIVAQLQKRKFVLIDGTKVKYPGDGHAGEPHA
jgi:hypothetical protein